MQALNVRRRFGPATMMIKLGVALMLIGGALTGCSGGLSESDVFAKLEAAGLTVEKLSENLLTNRQRQRIENPMETVLPVKVSDSNGNSQKMTIIWFDKAFMAESAKYEGVPGFVVGNIFFAGIPNPQIEAQIEAALQ